LRRLGILAAQNAQQGFALRWARALVDDDLRLAMTAMDRSRP
jgi:hypothetical protein